ncbi:hypothetical protein [Magnetospirillum sp. SS-4]|uniref:hypothetical protein n=1 Tax=Magnetospirillum sp. SS-4 TaxID=2681465 RepID=UPI001572CCB5|nr:hypothetical protein [Magnetospirillum sp. SS-4]
MLTSAAAPTAASLPALIARYAALDRAYDELAETASPSAGALDSLVEQMSRLNAGIAATRSPDLAGVIWKLNEVASVLEGDDVSAFVLSFLRSAVEDLRHMGAC